MDTGTAAGAENVEALGATGTAAGGPRDEVVTFDVFETVLVRAVSPPAAVFDLVGRRAVERGLVACSPQAYSQARAWAESRALHWHRAETTLERICTELVAALGLPREAREALAELEMEVEAGLLQPVPAGVRLVQEHRSRTGSVVYVSDMYLPAQFIEDQLVHHGLFLPGDVLYVSHAHGETKRSGGLYGVVADAEGVPAGSLLHHGNDLRADVKGATSAGVRSVFLPAANPTRYEQALQRHRTSTDGLTAGMAGASRLARLHVEPQGEREEALVGVAAGVMAPVLTAFVTWVLRRAEAEGLRRVYFVARDGQVLLRIAERLAPRLGIDVELHYLYASRLVWNRVVASPTKNPQVWHSLIGLSSDGVSNIDILERTGLAADVVERVVAASGAGPDVWRSTTQRRPLFETLDRIEADGTLAAAQEGHRAVVMRYLHEQGLLDGTPHAFVDVGWRGTQHDVLLELQQETEGSALSHGLFFGLDASASPWAGHREAYFFDSRGDAVPTGEDRVPVGGPAYLPDSLRPGGSPLGIAQFALIEIFCSGDHGTLTRYDETPDGVVPVLKPGRKEAVEAWGLPLVWRTVDAYVDHLPVDRQNPYLHVDVHLALTSVMRLFWELPTDAEVQAWAGFPWEVGQGVRQRIVPLAGPFQLVPIATGAVSGGRPSLTRVKQLYRRAQRTEWTAASIRLSPLPARALLRPRATVKDAVGRGTPVARRVLRGGAHRLKGLLR
ncbi:hypothetical protein [Aquipuribacter hungaricus]|uniref:HAD family hydrolase n=1 Tax=Aquipuribacter hungaricus TaxID=545624 RepID=A0ABV7WJF3_9MICO